MPKLRPAPNAPEEPEIEDHTPPTEAIEIELAPEPSPEAEIELAPPTPAPEPQSGPTGAPAAPTLAPDDALQRAVDAQRRAEEIQRDTARQLRERDAELARVRDESEDAQYNSVLTAIAAEQATLDKAEGEYAAAAAAGDWAAAGKIQRGMVTAGARLTSLEDGKQAFESRREAAKTATVPQPSAQDPVEQRISSMPVPDAAKDWLRNHREYLTDVRKNSKLQSAHWDALDDAGGESQVGTPKYIEALETRLGIRQAAPAPQPEPAPASQPQRRSTTPMTAPVSRDVPTVSGQRASPTKITLSAEERLIAHNSFSGDNITNAEKEKLYAQGKKRMNEAKANGTYGQERQ